MITTIDHRFGIGDIVYLVTDNDQLPRIVYSVKLIKDSILYEIACGTTVSTHYDFEMSESRNVLLTV